MKKLLIGATVFALLLGFGAAGVQADIHFPNNTEVQSWANSALYTGPVSPSTTVPGHGAYWYDVIGDSAVFDTTGADLSGSKLTIHTNWPGPDKVDSFTGYHPGAVTADLFIRYNTTTGTNWDFAIALGSMNPTADNAANSRLGTYYTNPSYNTSTFYFGTSGLIYGGKYNTGTVGNEVGADVPVFATGTGTFEAGLVTWGTDPVIDLSKLPGFDMSKGWNFLWGTGTCANDTAQGMVVPLPGALLLLGAGLTRLAAYAQRRRKESIA
jgi:hypothetical protein